MKLSPQDQAYWKDRLGWKAFAFLVASTVIMGCIVWPIALFALNLSSGHPQKWSLSATMGDMGANFMLALLVSTIMWFVGQLYVWMEWLPPRS